MRHIINKIKKILKSKFDRINNERLKTNLLNALPYWLAAFMAGAAAVAFAKLFTWAEMGTHWIYDHAKWVFFVVTPVCFLIAWWLPKKFAPFARGSGIPQVTAAIELSNPKHNYQVNTLLSLKIIFIKVLSALTLVFGGGIIGREGPTIQISASIFKKVNDWLPAWYPKISKRNMIVTGAAAGLAAAFNTPLGGIVFAIEELTKTHFSFFKSALLTGVIIAGLTALNFLGPYLYLGYPQLGDISAWTILLLIPLAIFTGLSGGIMCELILFIARVRKSLKKNYQNILFVIFCGLIVASFALFIDRDVFGSGKDIMVRTLFTDEKHLPWYLPFLKVLGLTLSFSTGAGGGVFAPSLSMGAGFGAVYAGWLNIATSETNLIILCGMTGFLTAVTRSPFTSSILVLEMTNSHNVIFYIMLTALLANLSVTLVSRHAFYDKLKMQYIYEIHKSEEQVIINPEETKNTIVEEPNIESNDQQKIEPNKE